MSILSEYASLDGTSIAGLVRTGDISPAEVATAARGCIARWNGSLNAVVHEFEPEYPADLNGPFVGVPMLLKNTALAVRGQPLTSASRLYADVVNEEDGTLAQRYRKAGFVFLGRTNVPEIALSFTTESLLYGPCRNPWDLSRSPGGSSGGSAAAVASGMVPISYCSDGAGSIRVPAAHCGVFGFKPTRMRVPLGPAVAEGNAGMATAHAITRSVRDSALLLDASAGPDAGDPYAAPPAEGPFLAELEKPRRGLRIGLVLDAPNSRWDEACLAAARDAAQLCESLGHHVELVDAGYDNSALKQAWRLIAGVSAARTATMAARRKGISDPGEMMEPVNAAWIAEGRKTGGMDYLSAVQTLHGTSRAMARFFSSFDVFLSPTTAQVAPPLGWLADRELGLDAYYDRFWGHAPHTAVFNASGCPAMSVPLYWTEEGLPVGVQFGAAFGADGLLFSLAGELERARPWMDRRPSLA